MTERKYTTSDRLRQDFTILPNSIVRSERLTGNAKALYAIMVDAAHRGAEPEQEELGRLLGGGKKAAATALKQLVETELVTSRRRGRGLTNAYTVHHPSEVKKGREGTSRRAATAQLEGPPGPNHARTREEAELQLQDRGANAPGAEAPPEPYEPTPFDHLARVCGIDRTLVIKGEGDTYDKDLARELAVALRSIKAKAGDTGGDEGLGVQIQLRATLYRRRWPEVELTPSALAKHWNRISVPTTRGRAAANGKQCPVPGCGLTVTAPTSLEDHIHNSHPDYEETQAA